MVSMEEDSIIGYKKRKDIIRDEIADYTLETFKDNPGKSNIEIKKHYPQMTTGTENQTTLKAVSN